jgi:predicted transposase YbfD/YdcC
VARGHGYIIPVKGNQPTLYQAAARLSDTPALDAWSWDQTGHGHDAHCRIKVWAADEAMQAQWAGLKHYASVRRQGERNGQSFDTTTYYITSESMSAWCLAQRIRGHRKIENTLHWTKDVVLNEDGCGLLDSQQAANMAVIRNIGFNLLTMAGYKSISAGIQAMGERIDRLWALVSQPAKKNPKESKS